MEINDAQILVDRWIRKVGVRYFSELTNTAILTEEVGEVASLMARMFGDQSFKSKDDESVAHDLLADEISDVLFVLICIANQTGIDLERALIMNIEKKTERDKDRHKNNPKLQ